VAPLQVPELPWVVRVSFEKNCKSAFDSSAFPAPIPRRDSQRHLNDPRRFGIEFQRGSQAFALPGDGFVYQAVAVFFVRVLDDHGEHVATLLLHDAVAVVRHGQNLGVRQLSSAARAWRRGDHGAHAGVPLDGLRGFEVTLQTPDVPAQSEENGDGERTDADCNSSFSGVGELGGSWGRSERCLRYGWEGRNGTGWGAGSGARRCCAWVRRGLTRRST
jgi:hypothetical protein